jgi:hypothetical protein
MIEDPELEPPVVVVPVELVVRDSSGPATTTDGWREARSRGVTSRPREEAGEEIGP